MTQLVAGVDSSTQSCKVVVRDAESGALVRSGSAAHPAGTEVSPLAWWEALETAIRAAGGLDDVAAVSVGAQQHGMVCLDGRGDVVRPALLWNDTRSAAAADALVAEAGGPDAWAAAVAAYRSPRSRSRSCGGSPSTNRTRWRAPRRSACRMTG